MRKLGFASLAAASLSDRLLAAGSHIDDASLDPDEIRAHPTIEQYNDAARVASCRV